MYYSVCEQLQDIFRYNPDVAHDTVVFVTDIDKRDRVIKFILYMEDIKNMSDIENMKSGQSMNRYEEGGLSFDFANGIFRKGAEILKLSPNEQKLLWMLVSNSGRLMTRDELYAQIWGSEARYVDDDALIVMTNRLRGMLESDIDGVTYIQTVYGKGYMWEKKLP